jgi:hypothetical protein
MCTHGNSQSSAPISSVPLSGAISRESFEGNSEPTEAGDRDSFECNKGAAPCGPAFDTPNAPRLCGSDSAGNLYGGTEDCGEYGGGVLFAIKLESVSR